MISRRSPNLRNSWSGGLHWTNLSSNVSFMTNFRRRSAAADTHDSEATSLTTATARALLANEDASVMVAVMAGGLLRLTPREVFG